MSNQLKLSIGQYSDKGRKALNQDFHGALIPKEPQLSLKGAALAVADGISSSSVSQIASAAAVKSFLDDYFCTSEAWTVRTAAERVIAATNSWLHSQTRRSDYCYDKDRGYVCTLSAMVIKAATAHIFHVGDSRIYRVHEHALEQLTKDHRLWVSRQESYLSRALGIDEQLEIDYQALAVKPGDTFILATDGIYEHCDTQFLLNTLREHPTSLDNAARQIAEHALERGSSDNLTLQIVRVDQVPGAEHAELQLQIEKLPLPPPLEPRMQFDGYEIVRELHATSRSHVFLAVDLESGNPAALKTPAIDLSDDPDYLERFLLEEWIARRINSAHVLKAQSPNRSRHYLYTAMEYIEGQTLRQWLLDNPRPDIETVRSIVEQIARGLRAFHRMEMLHQDLRPDNIMIDRHGTVKIIDFGATRVAGIAEATVVSQQAQMLGTALFTAPEYFLGFPGSTRSDQFSLGVICYQMLSGRFPYGTEVAKCRNAKAQQKLSYDSVLDEEREIPAWVDEALKRATHISPEKRYDDLSEFIYDLRHPNRAFLNKTRPPLIERNPVQFWQGVSALLACALIYLLANPLM
ncbi:bifunctional protein-serine/threonine kinase/phosphatase [Marinobacterium sp. D7]|uniref:bifunctional protein-serine/threonine kinase/phosphatase n=1 Tax=Marinobacterium ramblicola TaxID=2849041 RepID=UPI001C2CEDB6|nr:bifunctional protein-serine/threonine kinase/phosphatase [Marinobacterium ramblicola]MBV1787490.1 bifunctional protein-serine/threonine kinase/phosphatase [Marinobacterium ramblicola]